jgi:lipopolysaccharide export system protein LptA
MCCRSWIAFVGAVVTLWWLSLAGASEPTSGPAEPPKPMSITSRSMTVKNLEQRVVFDRDVTISSGDMDLSADHVEVILVQSADSSGGAPPFLGGAGPSLLAEDNIERIVAEGRVKVVQGKKTATADHAVYQRADETVVLTGHP